MKTRLSAQQTEYMQERFAGEAVGSPKECAELLKVLNTMGPEVTAGPGVQMVRQQAKQEAHEGVIGHER